MSLRKRVTVQILRLPMPDAMPALRLETGAGERQPTDNSEQ